MIALVVWLSERLEIPVATFAKYAGRAQTMTDHARILAAALGLRPATAADLPFVIEAAAQAAWSTDRGHPIATGVIGALRAEKVILPAPAVGCRQNLARWRQEKRLAFLMRLYRVCPRDTATGACEAALAVRVAWPEGSAGTDIR